MSRSEGNELGTWSSARLLKVVVVEDSDTDLWFFSEIARSRGHVVTACESGEDALACFEEGIPDLVILDLLLPGVDGIEVCRRLRALPGGDVPVVLVATASEEPRVLRDALEAGADDFLRKPADADLVEIRLAIAERRIIAQRELAHAEEDLASRARELQTLFGNVQHVFFSVDVTEMRLIQISPATSTIFGYDPEALGGEDALWKTFLLPAPEGGRDPWSRLREQGPSDPIVEDYRIRRADGVERWVRISLQVRPDRDRGGLRADGVLRDITEQRHARDQLAARNRELAALYRLSEKTLAATSLEEAYGEILSVVTEVTGWPIAGIEYVDHTRGVVTLTAIRGGSGAPGAERPVEGWISEDVASGRPVLRPDTRSARLDVRGGWLPSELASYAAFPLSVGGESFGALFLASAEPRETGDRLRHLGTNLARTVAIHLERLESEEALRESETRHRLLAEQLKQANQELESFAYSVSHDLRAPLRTMQGFAHTLLQEYEDRIPEEGRGFLRRIIDSGRESERLIGDLLAYSRLSFEKVELKAVDLRAIVDATLEQVRGDLDDAGARVDVGEPLPTVLGNHTTLVQILANLLSNAAKFVAEGTAPQIRIRTEQRGEMLRLWVEDNGIGVPAGQEERIFGVFERLSEHLERPGTGIGLAIVRRGVQRIGGASGVERRPEGGSAFWIEVPLERRQTPRRRARRG